MFAIVAGWDMALERALFGSILSFACFCASAQAPEKIAVANEGGIRDRWMLAPGASLPVPAYPKAYEASGAEVCVAIGYVLNADGTTSDFSLLKSWSADEPKLHRDQYWSTFAADASAALARWKFAPRPEVTGPKPVYTVATFLFGATNATELRRKCAIPSLSTRLVELRYDAKAGRKMAFAGVFDRLDLDPGMVTRVDQQRRNDAIAERQAIQRPRPKR
jgi:hypothetical protein